MITILAQFLCVMNGGKLVQNISDHALFETHPIYNNKNVCYEITSTHHQMQYPFEMNEKDYDILYWTHRSKSYGGDNIDRHLISCDVEIAIYHKDGLPKCLAIQGHPEYMRHESPVVMMINDLVNNYVK